MNKFVSRKLIVTLAAIAAIIASRQLGVELSPAELAAIGSTVFAYLFGQSYIDKHGSAEKVKAGESILKMFSGMLSRPEKRLTDGS